MVKNFTNRLIQKTNKQIKIGPIIFFTILLLLKAIIMYIVFDGTFSTTNEFSSFSKLLLLNISLNAFQSDLIIFIIIISLVLITYLSNKKRRKILSSSVIVALTFVYIGDTALIILSSRLFIMDIPKYLFNIVDRRIRIFMVFILSLFIGSYYALLKIKFNIKAQYIIKLCLLLFVFHFLPLSGQSLYLKKDFFTKNYLILNLDIGYTKEPDNYEKSAKDYTNRFIKQKGINKKQNFIFLVSESLSTIDSKRIGGLYDYVPLYDIIQQDGITYSNFIANSNQTEGGYIGLLQGIEPIPYKISTNYYDMYPGYTTNLIEFFNNLNYDTIFLSSSDLSFLDTDIFFQKLGFQTIIGREAFEGKPRYAFRAPPDEEIYKKAIDIVNEYENNNKQMFLTIKSISSHLNYDTPYGKTKEAMYKYTDEHLYKFYNELKKTNFFDNGTLLIVSDHRKMTPIEPGEFQKYGMSSYGRILATIIGKDIPKNVINNNLYQHTDFFYSIKSYWGDEFTAINNYNNIFSDKIQRNYAITPYFSDKNVLIVTDSSGSSHTLRLDGSDTNFIETTLDYNQQKEILEYINEVRSFHFLNKN